MAQSLRQSKLFAAEDYTAIYDSYINANFQAYDYDTIRSTMVDYVRDKYPENYNDWIESSEFVAILDLIAQFGHNLAFRADLNTRNNFLSTAQRQDSVFKLAEFLGYQPRRNVAASGELKVVAVKTNETVIGSDGTTLAGKEIRYENTSNINNLDDFITVMNAVLTSGNQFGSPRQALQFSGVDYHYYNLNNDVNQIVFSVNGIAQGVSASYDIFGMDMDGELNPRPDNAFGILYKNDGSGITSVNNGFFFGFKQGSLQYKDFNIDSPISNLKLDIDVDNINNSDVWVQSIDEDGNVITQWLKVDNVFAQNEIFNNRNNEDRSIFAVKTRANNQISVMFPDESFGAVPKNIIRVWYRVSDNATYTLRPDDIANKNVNINYIGLDGNTYTATFTLQLKVPVSNASASESLDAIKTNAPRQYVTQDRMITPDDYNNYLINQSEQVLKIKSINRTHSGHSRYITLNDPTGTYSNLRLFGTDGILSKTDATKIGYTDVISANSVFEKYIKPIIADHELLNLYYSKFKNSFEDLKTTASETEFYWQTNDNNTGYFLDASNIIQGVGKTQTHYLKYVTVGSLIKFTNGNDVYWTRVSSIFASGRGVDDAQGEPTGLTVTGSGAIALDAEIPTGASLEMIYPAFAKQFTKAEREVIIAFIKSKQEFAIKYDYENIGWDIVESPVPTALPNNFTKDDNSWLIKVNPTTVGDDTNYDITLRTVRYSVETDQIEFTNITNEYTLDEHTKKRRRDIIELRDPVTDTVVKFYVYGHYLDENGLYVSNKVILALLDNSSESRADNPDAYYDIAGTEAEKVDLRYEWTHVPADNELVDPSLTNIIDVFVLINDYSTEFANWLNDTTGTIIEPQTATIDELNRQFTSVDTKKAMSDTVIYRPVKYKVLFGSKSEPDFRARFNAIKVPGVNLTDNDVKSKIIDAINDFFALENWDFGETFYFTELAAYVHNQLIGVISSFVIIPESTTSVFGSLFQITPMSDELFIPDVKVSDIDIVDNITQQNIRAS